MSRLRPQLLLDLFSSNSNRLSDSGPSAKRRRSRWLQMVLLFAGLGAIAQANPAQAASFTWSSTPGAGNDWAAGTLDGGPANNPFQTTPQSGVTLQFNWNTFDGANFVAGRPSLGEGVIDGGLTSGNLLVIFASTDVPSRVELDVNFTNAAGDVVPVRNLRYTLIDIDRDNSRDWQDVTSTFGRFGGTPAAPNSGGAIQPTVVPGSQGETVEEVTGNQTAIGYTEPAAARTFRGITDPSPENLGLNGGEDDEGVEADNFRDEGSVTLNYPGTLIDSFRIVYGNGVSNGALNGLGFNIPSLDRPADVNDPNPLSPTNPTPHGIGVLGDFNFEPAIIGIAKTASDPVFQPDGSFRVTYTMRVTNTGEVPLDNAVITEDVVPVFGGAANFNFVAGSLTGALGGETFNGSTDTTIALAGGTLAPNESRDVSFQVDILPAAGPGPFANQATVVAEPQGFPGIQVTDRSANGTNVDADVDDPDDGTPLPPTFTAPNGNTVTRGTTPDNDPSNNDSPTVVSLTFPPRIGVTKQVTNVINNGDGTFDVTYRQIVCNRSGGTVGLTNVQLTENLDDTFRLGQPNGVTAYTVQSVTSPAAVAGVPNYRQITPNAGFNGGAQGDQNLLGGTDPLNTDECGVVDFVVRVTPGPNTGDNVGGDPPYEGQVTATGTGPGPANLVVTDLSDDVTSFPNAPLPIAEQLPRDTSNPANGTTTDPVDGNGVPQSNPIPANDPQAATNENNRTPIAFLPPQIGVTKQVTNVADNGNGTFTVTYRHIVCNLGNEALSNVTVTEQQDLATVFRQGQANGVTSAQFVPGSLVAPTTAPAGFETGFTPLAPTAGFNGTAGSLQLATVANLPVGGCGIVDYQVLVNPTDPLDPAVQNLGDGTLGNPANDDPPYVAQVEATGTGATSAVPVADLSDDVSNLTAPLPPAQQKPRDTTGNFTATDGANGPGTPGGPENDPTPVSLVANPQIGLTKQVVDIVNNGDGSFDVVFEYVVQNVGGTPLNGVTVADNYDDQFTANNVGPLANYQVISVVPVSATAPAPIVPDPAAVGRTQGSGLINLATGGATVYQQPQGGQPGQNATFRVTVRVLNPDPNALYDSSAIANGNSTVNGQLVTDLSDDIPRFGAANPANGIGVPGPGVTPGNPADPANTITPVVFAQASPLQLFKRITSFTQAGVTTPLTNLVNNPPVATFTGEVDIRQLGDLLSGDSVEYTVYFLNGSTQALTNVEVCDPLPSPLTIVNGSLTASQGTSTFISPLTPLSLASNPGRSCGASSGSQGAAVFNLGDIPANGNGFVRFNTQIP